MIQRANIDTLRALMLFLAKDCCQGSRRTLRAASRRTHLLLKERLL